jgi:hypothetical protein
LAFARNNAVLDSLPEMQHPQSTSQQLSPSSPSRVRKLFPETWLWSNASLG